MNKQSGVTLVELMAVVAILAIRLGISALYLRPMEAPLQTTGDLLEGTFRSARLEAMATTSAYRLRPLGTDGVIAEYANHCAASTWTHDERVDLELAIMGIALAAILPTFLTYSDTNDLSEERSGAVAAAQEIMEGLRQVNPASLPSPGASSPQLVPVGEREFEVVARFCTDVQHCGLDSRHILIEVSFGGRTIYTVESVYTLLR